MKQFSAKTVSSKKAPAPVKPERLWIGVHYSTDFGIWAFAVINQNHELVHYECHPIQPSDSSAQAAQYAGLIWCMKNKAGSKALTSAEQYGKLIERGTPGINIERDTELLHLCTATPPDLRPAYLNPTSRTPEDDRRFSAAKKLARTKALATIKGGD